MAEPIVLQSTALPPYAEADLKAFNTVRLPADKAEQEAFYAKHGKDVVAIACNGNGPVDDAMLAKLPSVKLIACISAGLEGIDTKAAEKRGVKVTTSSPALADELGDVAISLVLGLTRGTVAADRFVREGKWLKGQFPLGAAIKGMKIGILAMGHIGKATAKRLEVMGAEIGYNGPNKKDVPYRYFGSLLEMAKWARMIIVAAPGGEETRKLVTREVIEAIGPDGYLVNVSRGTVVDETALIEALRTGKLAGFASDVFEDEPRVPAALIESDRTVLLPHYGSGTAETRKAMSDAMIASLKDFFGKK
jgi:lactate dehydrogenase-like 2-hydroxyacid dehydrogenase